MQETQETQVQSLGRGDFLEEDTATSSILTWRLPCTEEPDGLQSIGSQTVGHDRATDHTHIRLTVVPVTMYTNKRVVALGLEKIYVGQSIWFSYILHSVHISKTLDG